MDTAFAAHQRDVFAANFSNVMTPDERDILITKFVDSDMGKKQQLLIARGWSASNVGLMSIFRTWLQEFEPEAYNTLLPAPEDRSKEAWLSWRLDAKLPEA